MAELTNEDLMRMADREVTPAEREWMLQVIAADPALQARLAEFEATGHSLAAAFAFVAKEPVPQRLIDAALGKAPAHARSRRQAAVPDWILRWLTPPALAAYAVGLLVAGACLGVLLIGSSVTLPAEEVLRVAKGRVQAEGTLKAALESIPSGQAMSSQSHHVGLTRVEPRLTFKTNRQSYCREYAMDQQGLSHSAGIACREDDGTWIVEHHLQVKAPPKGVPGIEPASGPGFGAVIDRLGGETLEPADEAEVLKRWRK